MCVLTWSLQRSYKGTEHTSFAQTLRIHTTAGQHIHYFSEFIKHDEQHEEKDALLETKSKILMEIMETDIISQAVTWLTEHLTKILQATCSLQFNKD